MIFLSDAMKVVGIDTGSHTAIAVWDSEAGVLETLGTFHLWAALSFVSRLNGCADDMLVRFEDARQRTWVPWYQDETRNRGRAQGAGYVKAHCSIWAEFLQDKGIRHEAVAPRRNVTKLDAEAFRRVTGWEGRTNEHERDAAMLVYGYGGRGKA